MAFELPTIIRSIRLKRFFADNVLGAGTSSTLRWSWNARPL